jgi:hypothetical protein
MQMRDQADTVHSARRFLSPANVAILEKWGKHPQSPFERFEMMMDQAQLLIRITGFYGDFYSNLLVSAATIYNVLPGSTDECLRSL